MSLGLMKSERYSEEDEIQNLGKKGKLHHYLDLGTLDRSDPGNALIGQVRHYPTPWSEGCHGTSRPIVSGMEQDKTSSDSQQWRKKASQVPHP